ncbi:MAG: hypothetical protein ACI8RE_001363, partial [Ilumatobacter sp.]
MGTGGIGGIWRKSSFVKLLVDGKKRERAETPEPI